MPCTFTGSIDGDSLYFAKQELDKLTRMLCTVCKTAERFPSRPQGQIFEDAELRDWWEKHKELDASRKKAKRPKITGPQFYQCGSCGFWHPIDWEGDCRDNDARFTTGQLDILFPDKNGDGWPDWIETDKEERN